MRKLLTSAIAAGMLMAVFSAYGDTSNLVFYSDFENSEDAQAISTSADLNGATLAPPSLFDQIPPAGWVIGSLGKNSASQFRSGAVSMVAFLNFRSGANVIGNLSAPAPFKGGTAAVQFSYDFKPNSGNKGIAQTIRGYDINNNIVFTIKMNSIAGVPQYMVTVNDTQIGFANRNSSSVNPLNSISLTLDATGINVTLINASTLVPITVTGIPAGGGPALSRFTMATDNNLASSFDYDNFQVWAIERVPPPPRLDLYIVAPE